MGEVGLKYRDEIDADRALVLREADSDPEFEEAILFDDEGYRWRIVEDPEKNPVCEDADGYFVLCNEAKRLVPHKGQQVRIRLAGMGTENTEVIDVIANDVELLQKPRGLDFGIPSGIVTKPEWLKGAICTLPPGQSSGPWRFRRMFNVNNLRELEGNKPKGMDDFVLENVSELVRGKLMPVLSRDVVCKDDPNNTALGIINMTGDKATAVRGFIYLRFRQRRSLAGRYVCLDNGFYYFFGFNSDYLVRPEDIADTKYWEENFEEITLREIVERFGGGTEAAMKSYMESLLVA